MTSLGSRVYLDSIPLRPGTNEITWSCVLWCGQSNWPLASFCYVILLPQVEFLLLLLLGNFLLWPQSPILAVLISLLTISSFPTEAYACAMNSSSQLHPRIFVWGWYGVGGRLTNTAGDQWQRAVRNGLQRRYQERGLGRKQKRRLLETEIKVAY